jgi:hypothetical protein
MRSLASAKRQLEAAKKANNTSESANDEEKETDTPPTDTKEIIVLDSSDDSDATSYEINSQGSSSQREIPSPVRESQNDTTSK